MLGHGPCAQCVRINAFPVATSESQLLLGVLDEVR
jgi:hypothetical protein